jgi:hypothetical protein
MRPLRSPEQLMMEFAKDKMLVLPQGSRLLLRGVCPTFGIQACPACGTIHGMTHKTEKKAPAAAPQTVAPQSNLVGLVSVPQEDIPKKAAAPAVMGDISKMRSKMRQQEKKQRALMTLRQENGAKKRLSSGLTQRERTRGKAVNPIFMVFMILF